MAAIVIGVGAGLDPAPSRRRPGRVRRFHV